MPTAYTSLLGLALPVEGELSGTWGDVVNDSITSLLDSAVAGTTTISADSDITLTTTTGAANQARAAVLNWTATGTVTRTITAPAQSKAYIVINATGGTQSIKVVGVGPTTGVTILAGEKTLIAWNGTDFVKVCTFGGAATFKSITADSITDTGLTDNRVVLAGTGGLLEDSANLTFDGTTLTITAAVNITGNEAITGALTVSADSAFNSTGALKISRGTQLQRPGTPAVSMIRYNTDTNEFEGYSGASPSWKSIGGSALSNDTTTSSNLYPVFAAATSGTAQNLYTSNDKLLYKPSTGELQATAMVSVNGIMVNGTTVSEDYTIATGQNGFSIGPITVASGVSVTVSSGQRWVIQ